MLRFKPLNLNISLNPEFKIPELTEQYRIQKYSPDHVLSRDTLNLLQSLDCEVREIQLFSSMPMQNFQIHIDGHGSDNGLGAINLVINNNTKWKMEWFTRLNDTELEKLVSSGTTSYMKLKENECKFLSSHQTNGPFLVRVDIPHRIVNNDITPRHCISIRFLNNDFERLVNILT
jgi:hypothetical protein